MALGPGPGPVYSRVSHLGGALQVEDVGVFCQLLSHWEGYKGNSWGS